MQRYKRKDGDPRWIYSEAVSSEASKSPSQTTTGTILTAWKHYAVTVDRNGNMTSYLNGASDGTPTSVSAIGTGTNSANIYIGRDGTNFGQVDVGGVRVYRWAVGGLPSNVAMVISNHYTGERTYYGV